MFKLLKISERTHKCEFCHCPGAKYEFKNPFTNKNISFAICAF